MPRCCGRAPTPSSLRPCPSDGQGAWPLLPLRSLSLGSRGSLLRERAAGSAVSPILRGMKVGQCLRRRLQESMTVGPAEQGFNPRWTCSWLCRLRQVTPSPVGLLWGASKLMGGPTALNGVAGCQPWPQRHGEATLSAQPSPRRPYLAPSLSQAVCLSVWGRLDAGCSHAKLGSSVCLLLTPVGRRG